MTNEKVEKLKDKLFANDILQEETKDEYGNTVWEVISLHATAIIAKETLAMTYNYTESEESIGGMALYATYNNEEWQMTVVRQIDEEDLLNPDACSITTVELATPDNHIIRIVPTETENCLYALCTWNEGVDSEPFVLPLGEIDGETPINIIKVFSLV